MGGKCESSAVPVALDIDVICIRMSTVDIRYKRIHKLCIASIVVCRFGS